MIATLFRNSTLPDVSRKADTRSGLISRRTQKGFRVTLLLMCLSGVFLLVSCGPISSGQKENRPSVILISIDTLRADHIHGYGYGPETSPTLDDLMKRGEATINGQVLKVSGIEEIVFEDCPGCIVCA